MSFAVCFLAHGIEHVDEYNKIRDRIGNETFVLTNDSNLFASNVILDDTKFNFNKKRIPIKRALEKYDTVVCLDTDIDIICDLSLPNDLCEGLHVKWLGKSQTINNTRLSISELLNGKTQFEDLNNYGQSLTDSGANNYNTFFFDEYAFILKILDKEKRTLFIDNWNLLYEKTLKNQAKDRHTGKLEGSIESLIISLACEFSNIGIFTDKCKNFFDSIVHYGSVQVTKKLV